MIRIQDRISGRKAGTMTVLLCFVLFLSGCSTSRNTAASRFYHAGVAKYNTWFNGKQAFDKAVLAQEKAKKDIDGGLIGGAALKAADFAGIIAAAAAQ